jgi:mandelate racemase
VSSYTNAAASTAREVRIESLGCTPVLVPMRYTLGTSAAAVKQAPLVLLDVRMSDGIVGRAYCFAYSTSGVRAIVHVLDEALDMVRGEPLAPADVARKLERRFALLGVTGVVRMALSLLDMALWDALAVCVGQPLARVLGATTKAMPAYNSCGLGLMKPEMAADEALQLLEGGFKAVKLRLGYHTLAGDVAAVRAVRKALPDDVKLLVDYNQALSTVEALGRGRAIQDEGITWLEEPIRHDDYAGNAQLARELIVPIQIGENFNGPAALAQALGAGACDLVMPDVARIGGVTGWMQAAGLAAAHGVPTSSHLMPEVSSHLLAATRTAHYVEYVDWAAVLLQEPLRIEDGSAVVPDTPGTGIAWDDAAVAKFRMS